MRSLLTIGLLIAILILAKIFIFNKKDNAAMPNSNAKSGNVNPASKGMPVDVYIAKKQTVANDVFATGSMVPNEEVTLKSETSGRIIDLNIKEGGYVSKGQLIAKINDSDIKAAIKKANYEQDLAAQIEARQKRLLDINAISKEEYEIAVNKINTLSADKEALMVALEKTEIRAPFSGIIGLKEISIGAYVTPGTSIASMVQTNPMKIDFSVPEKYTKKVKIGQEINYTLDGDLTTYKAKIAAIDSRIDETLRTLKVRATSANDKNKFLPGMFVKVTMPISESNAIMIPSEAIVPVLSGKILYIIKNGKATEAKITSGLRDEKNVEVLEGLVEGDSVIVSALMNLKSGQAVIAKQVVNP